MDWVSSEGSSGATPILDNLLLLPWMLRQAGLPISLDQTLSFAQGLTLIDATRRDEVFHTARALLVTRSETLRLFEIIFNSFWRICRDVDSPRHRQPPEAGGELRRRTPFTVVDYVAFKSRKAQREVEIKDRTATFSSQEFLQQKAFADLTSEELDAVRSLIREMRWSASLRRTRRRIGDRKGQTIDLRQALRTVARTGSVPPRPARRSRKIKPRSLILIADISGSMDTISRLVLHFFYSVRQSLRDVECFTFGTRLSRITQALAIRNVDRAIDEVSKTVIDYSGGTRIGESLQLFNRQWSRRVLRRGAVVLIVSDGWERGDADLLARQMRFIQARCHRLIWLNPLMGNAAYRPTVQGMAAALPYVDDFLPVHNLSNLLQLAEHLRALPSRRRHRAQIADL